MVAFSSNVHNTFLTSTIVYASINQSKIKEPDLLNLQVNHLLTWSFLGDFNAIMGAREHRDSNIDKVISQFKFHNMWTLH